MVIYLINDSENSVAGSDQIRLEKYCYERGWVVPIEGFFVCRKFHLVAIEVGATGHRDLVVDLSRYSKLEYGRKYRLRYEIRVTSFHEPFFEEYGCVVYEFVWNGC